MFKTNFAYQCLLLFYSLLEVFTYLSLSILLATFLLPNPYLLRSFSVFSPYLGTFYGETTEQVRN